MYHYHNYLNSKLGVIELFAGAAGLAQGFIRAKNYEVLALFDILEAAKKSYQKRYPNSIYECTDILNLKEKDIKEIISGKHIHGVLGGPPCQGFSLAGSKNPKHDKNALVGRYVEIVKSLSPDFLLMENVPQLLYHEQFQKLQTELAKDYHLTHAILNAAQYGAPQTRHRLFVLAYNKKHGVVPTWPKPTHGRYGQTVYSYRNKRKLRLTFQNSEEILGADPVIQTVLEAQREMVPVHLSRELQPLITVEDAVSDLYPINGIGDKIPYPKAPKTAYQHLLRGSSTFITNHIPREHLGNPLEIVRAMPEGGNLLDISPDLWPSNKKYYSQAYGRLHRRGLARTLTTYFQNAGSGRFYHYAQERTLTVREAARLQGFSDDFEFCGTLAEQMQLVGNAVPLPLAEVLGNHIFRQIGMKLAVEEKFKIAFSKALIVPGIKLREFGALVKV